MKLSKVSLAGMLNLANRYKIIDYKENSMHIEGYKRGPLNLPTASTASTVSFGAAASSAENQTGYFIKT